MATLPAVKKVLSLAADSVGWWASFLAGSSELLLAACLVVVRDTELAVQSVEPPAVDWDSSAAEKLAVVTDLNGDAERDTSLAARWVVDWGLSAAETLAAAMDEGKGEWRASSTAARSADGRAVHVVAKRVVVMAMQRAVERGGPPVELLAVALEAAEAVKKASSTVAHLAAASEGTAVGSKDSTMASTAAVEKVAETVSNWDS